MTKRERLPFRVVKGGLEPADGYTVKRLRERGYKIGNVLMAILTKPRSHGFNRLAHKIGDMVVQNIEDFAGIAPHDALKRLQVEAQVACDYIGIRVPKYGMMTHAVPRSFSFDRMDQGEFEEAVKGICRHIADNYWHDLTPEQVREMAEMMPDE